MTPRWYQFADVLAGDHDENINTDIQGGKVPKKLEIFLASFILERFLSHSFSNK